MTIFDWVAVIAGPDGDIQIVSFFVLSTSSSLWVGMGV